MLTCLRAPSLKRDAPLGVEFAEALLNLLRTARNRVLIEALRGLSRRRWKTWFEAPIPQGVLYNSPELAEGNAYGGTVAGWGMDDEDQTDKDETDEDELGVYEEDLTGAEDEARASGSVARREDDDPELMDLDSSGSKDGWFARFNSKWKERREARINKSTPFCL